MEWINCNRDIFRKAIRILASRRFNLKKKKNDDRNPPWFRFKCIRAEQHVCYVVAVFARLSSKQTRTRINHESVLMYSKFEISTVLRRASKRIRGTATFPSPLRSSYHSHAFPRCLINHRKMMFRSNSVSTANLAYPFL